MEQELNRSRIGFYKSDNAFLAVDNVAALQAAVDRLSPQSIRKQLDYWTFLLGPKFFKKERSQMNLSRFPRGRTTRPAPASLPRTFITPSKIIFSRTSNRVSPFTWPTARHRRTPLFALRREGKKHGRWLEIGTARPDSSGVIHAFVDRTPIGGFNGYVCFAPIGTHNRHSPNRSGPPHIRTTKTRFSVFRRFRLLRPWGFSQPQHWRPAADTTQGFCRDIRQRYFSETFDHIAGGIDTPGTLPRC